MLHQENNESFLRRHIEQLACGSPRGMDNITQISFLRDTTPQFAKRTKTNLFILQKGQGNPPTCLVNTVVPSSLMASGVKEALAVDHKRSAPMEIPHVVECKRLKHNDHIIPEKYHCTEDADEYVPDYPTNIRCDRSFNPPAYESEESEDEGLNSPVHFSIAHNYVEENQCSPSLYRREEIFSSMGTRLMRKPVPIGSNHQAELPECRSGSKSGFMDHHSVLSSPSHICYEIKEDEGSKWIRNCVMPMPGPSALSSSFRPVYHKAGCGCIDEDSINCVRKHVREARLKLEGALGRDTFKELGFYDMGEEVASRWTEEEEHIFQEVVSSNPASLGRNFWDELPLAFPCKSSKELVSYYFNVFILRKRAGQNRSDPINVDSDNDEWEESDDDEFVSARRADKDLLLESLTDQDEGVCNHVLEQNIYEESDEEDELDYGSGHEQENCCNVVEGAAVTTEVPPEISFMDQNRQIFRFDEYVQDDSCTSFEAQQVCVVDGTPTDFAEEHGYFGSHCDLKAWEFGFTGKHEDEFLSTNNVIEEVFGKGYCENENDAANDQDDIF
ncbi:hypothetical protein GUJ93_ZPchr0014g46596 [Zizania palustris]|uniref:Myb-like domain-containing protein n=1 Tax=Zizania palustris TaxID=103762 RepID=A0A8J5TKQ1_ZIZPA|nr:hypothetical protein GUJ93_ZPchr0014g46596 [Zizania palustris]KAG8081922.1 hypothetical protein GUJ93_ZPchr0014g46596 [Zizania palustris]